ncbi:MAG: hypothetical protein WCG26_00035 [Chloroflexales bacterium]
MSSRTLRLSGDELAYTLAQFGRPDIGHGVLQGMSDVPLAAEDAVQRILAAGHGLMARQLLQINAEATPVLADDLQWIAGVLVQAPFSLRYSLTNAEATFNLTYHAANGGVVEHVVDQGVVHIFTQHEQPRAAVDGGLTFFQIAGLHSEIGSQGEITKALLDQAQEEQEVAAIQKILAQATLTAPLREQFAEDLAQTSYRGSVMRVEYGPNGEPVADRGLLLLGGPARLWILKPNQRPTGTVLTLIPGSESVFRREVSALMK